MPEAVAGCWKGVGLASFGRPELWAGFRREIGSLVLGSLYYDLINAVLGARSFVCVIY